MIPSLTLALTMLLTEPAASSVTQLKVPWPARVPQSVSKPNADGKPAAITFPWLGRVLVAPLKQAGSNEQRCSVRLTSRADAPQTVMTMPTAAEAAADMVPTICLSIRAFGRVPSPPGTYRIGLIYSGFTGYVLRPDNTYIVPVILTRTNRNPKWVIDDALVSKLSEAGIETVPAIRRWLERRKL